MTCFDILNIEYMDDIMGEETYDYPDTMRICVKEGDNWSHTEDAIRKQINNMEELYANGVKVVDFTAFYAGTNDPLRGNYEDYEAEEDYVDYTMWIYTKSAGGLFNGEWEDGESEEQVVKEWKELLREAIDENGDDLITADLRKHSNYDEDGVSQSHEMLFEYEHGEDNLADFEAEQKKLHPGLYRYKGKIGLRKGWTECQECDDLVKLNDINWYYLKGYGQATVCDECVGKYNYKKDRLSKGHRHGELAILQFMEQDRKAAEIVEYECARCGGLGDLCRGCSGLGADYPEEFGSCDLPEFPCPYCDATGKVTSNEKAKEFSRSIGYQLERVGEGMLGFSLFPTRMYHSKEKLEKIKAHKEEIMAQVANHYGLEPAEIEEDFWWADRWERGHDEFIEEVKATNGWGDPDILEKMLNNPEKWGGDSPYRAETFDGEDSLKFKEWAKQEMKTHGDDEDFDDWLYDEMGSHGDNVTLQDWGHHELDSHYERYGAEDNSECDVCSTTLSEGTIDLGCDKGCGAVLCEDCGGGAGNIIHSGWSIEGTCPDGTDEEFVCGNCSQLHGAEECTYCGYEMAISPCCETSYCYCQDFDCDCEKHYDPTGNNYPDIDDETGERYGNWEWSDDYWYQPKNAEELKRDSCCCGATKSKPCACMIQGVMECNATCPCALEKERNWGGDSHGQLATALRNARIKGKEPKKPLKIEKLDAETSGQWEIGEQLEEAQMNAEPYAGRTPEQQAILDERKRKLDYRLALGAKYPRKCSFCLVGIHKGLEDGSLTQEEFDTYMNDPMFPTEGGCERHDYWIAEDEKEKCPSCLEVTFLDGDVCDDCTYCEYCEEYHPDEITQICYENAYHKHYDGPDTDHEDYREAEDKKQKKISGILSNPFDEASLDSGGIKKLVVGGVIAAIAYLGYTKLK